MENIELRIATINDVDQLQEISRRTFADTYSWGNSQENMQEYLKKEFATEKLKRELTDANSGFYFAMLDDEAIGYIKINIGSAQTDMKDENTLEIERIYVLKEYQGKRIGRMLCEKAIEISTQKRVDYVWLGVWEKNPEAIRFYEKNGFVEFDRHIFKLGEDDQTDIMMNRRVN